MTISRQAHDWKRNAIVIPVEIQQDENLRK